MADIESWAGVESCSEGESVSLSGVVATAGVGTLKENGRDAQVLTMDEPPHLTQGDVPRQVMLVVPIERREYTVGEGLRFEGAVYTKRDDVVVVHAEGDGVREWFDSDELLGE